MAAAKHKSDGEGIGGTTLLIIDPQRSFHPGGSLAIPSANNDANRIASLIRRPLVDKGTAPIDRIVVTMDSHHKLHIAHPAFWVSGGDGKTMPEPFTIITTEDIVSGTWKPRPDLKISASDPLFDSRIFKVDDSLLDAENDLDLRAYCEEYTRRLESKGRFKLCIWPEHCLIGSTGHCVVPPIFDAMDAWCGETGGSIEFVLKGQNLLTEMYSALAAEVPLSDSTSFNTQLHQSLLESKKLLVCGQSMSHCVNYTLRDIVEHWPEGERGRISLLTDCASAVPGFEDAVETFLNDMKDAGVMLCTASDVLGD